MPLRPPTPPPAAGRAMGRRLRGRLLAALAGTLLAASGVLAAEPATAPAEASTAAPATGVAGPDCSRTLTLGLHEHGLLYTAETGEGIDKDIADEMARRSGCRITLTVLPRARIWQLVESGALDFTLSGIANRQREKFAAFAWYDANKYYLLVRRDAEVHEVGELLRRKRLRLGAIRSFRYGDSANALVDALDDDQRVSYATSLEPLYAILLDNRIQAMVIEPFDYPAIRGAELHAKTVIIEFDDPAVPHGLVMSRRSLPPAQQAAWRDVIDGMRADGTIRRIFGKYFPADLARTMTSF